MMSFISSTIIVTLSFLYTSQTKVQKLFIHFFLRFVVCNPKLFCVLCYSIRGFFVTVRMKMLYTNSVLFGILFTTNLSKMTGYKGAKSLQNSFNLFSGGMLVGFMFSQRGQSILNEVEAEEEEAVDFDEPLSISIDLNFVWICCVPRCRSRI